MRRDPPRERAPGFAPITRSGTLAMPEPTRPSRDATVPAEIPVEIPIEIPGERPMEAPNAPPLELPGESPLEVPGEGPVEVPAAPVGNRGA